MHYAILTFLLCSILTLAGCSSVLGVTSTGITGSGDLVSRDYDLAGFDTIDAGSNFRVTVRRGNDFAVKVTSDDNMIDNVKVTSAGGELTLGLKPGGWSLNNVTMNAEVTLPALKSVFGRDNAVVRFDQFEAGNFTLNLSGNAIGEGKVSAGKVAVVADGNAQAQLTGAADDLTARAKGNAVLTLHELPAEQVSVGLSNNAMATIRAARSLDFALDGNAGLTYTGGAKLGKQETRGNSWARNGQ